MNKKSRVKTKGLATLQNKFYNKSLNEELSYQLRDAYERVAEAIFDLIQVLEGRNVRKKRKHSKGRPSNQWLRFVKQYRLHSAK